MQTNTFDVRTCRHGRLPDRARAWFMALFFLAGALAWSPRAAAHAALISSSPQAGAVLTQAPEQVRLRFNEPVSPLVLKLIQPDGQGVALADAQVLPDGLALPMPRLDMLGTYALSWRVASADGHPVGGTVTFSIGIQDRDASQAGQGERGRDVLIWLARWLACATLFLSAGSAAAQALTSSRRQLRRTLRWSASLGATMVLFNAGLWGVDALDLPLAGFFSAAAWTAVWASSFGTSALLALAALACAALAPGRRTPLRQGIMAVAAIVLLGASFASTGHASAAPPAWLSMPAVWLHVVAVALWVGFLWPLASGLGDSPDLLLLQRFSRWIPLVLLVLFGAGSVLVYVQLDGMASLWQSAYGRVLLGKLALVALMLGLGAHNRYRLTSAVLRREIAPRLAMRRVIRIECLLALMILAVAALWRFTPPPRALAASAASTARTVVMAHVHGPDAMAELALRAPAPAAPGSRPIGGASGPGELQITLTDPAGQPLAAQEVDVVFSNPAAGLEPLSFPAERVSEGLWHVQNLQLPYQPDWQVRIDVLISDFDRVRLETTVRMKE